MSVTKLIPKEDRYLGDPLLKKTGVKYQFTKHEVEEYRKCKRSVKYFTENYFKIVHVDKGLIQYKPRKYQKKLVRLIHKNRFAIIKQCRQSGKCVHKDSLIRLRNKKTGKIIEMRIGDFYENMLDNEMKKNIKELDYKSNPEKSIKQCLNFLKL